MTAQEAYEGIHAWFSQPGKELSKLTNTITHCYYRHPNGRDRCAVGCILPDNLYDPLMEDVPFPRLLRVSPEICQLLGDDGTEDFLRNAQNLHDRAKSVKDFLDKLDVYALEFGLEPPIKTQTPAQELVNV